jgi:hypothetical protein
MKPKEKFHIIKIKKETCKKCGTPIGDCFTSDRIGISARSYYCVYNDHCTECADKIMRAKARKMYRPMIGAVIVKMETDRFEPTEITVAKDGKMWTIRGEYNLKVREGKEKR